MKTDIVTPDAPQDGASLLKAYRALKDGSAEIKPEVLESLYVDAFKLASVPPANTPRTFTKITLVDPTVRTVVSTASSAV